MFLNFNLPVYTLTDGVSTYRFRNLFAAAKRAVDAGRSRGWRIYDDLGIDYPQNEWADLAMHCSGPAVEVNCWNPSNTFFTVKEVSREEWHEMDRKGSCTFGAGMYLWSRYVQQGHLYQFFIATHIESGKKMLYWIDTDPVAGPVFHTSKESGRFLTKFPHGHNPYKGEEGAWKQFPVLKTVIVEALAFRLNQ